MEELAGVTDVTAGYMGGTSKPTYAEVCRGDSGHVEVVRVTFDESIVTYQILLDVFFSTHNPTTLNRQGNDVGEPYRSVIFTADEQQATTATAYIIMGRQAQKKSPRNIRMVTLSIETEYSFRKVPMKSP